MYAQKLRAVTERRGRLCVGIDPQPSVLDIWGLPRNVSGLERCARGLIEAVGDQVAVFKPQSAFFEAFGSRGVAVLEAVLSDISDCGALSLLDVKRGDIGSTMVGYANAYLSDGSTLAADAITLSPYLGFESLRPAITAAAESGRGVYVLTRTSNAEGDEIQLADSSGVPVAQRIVDSATEANCHVASAIGLVVGGTHADPGVDLHDFNGSILVPGIGAQGGQMKALAASFGVALKHVLPSVSREVLNIGREPAGLRGKVSELIDLAPG